jgi:tetratricopeptide (TPR) repeat protein
MGGWGLGSLLYNSGYLGYYNPYYTGYSGYGFDYSQPIIVAYNTDVVNPPPVSEGQSADDTLNAAIAAFQQNDYETALQIVNRGIGTYPDDAVLHEFRALVLFAKGDYQQAAATLHSLLAVGPGWDWSTMSQFYTDVATYTTQLRALEAAVKEHPDNAGARFVLAYHYLSDGFADNASHQLQEVVRQVPNDRVAAELLRMLTAKQTAPAGQLGQTPAESATPVPPPAAEAAATAMPIDPTAVIGHWKTARDDVRNPRLLSHLLPRKRLLQQCQSIPQP